jgi:hypothetical protein
VLVSCASVLPKEYPVAVTVWPAYLAFAAFVTLCACLKRLLCFLLPSMTADRSTSANPGVPRCAISTFFVSLHGLLAQDCTCRENHDVSGFHSPPSVFLWCRWGGIPFNVQLLYMSTQAFLDWGRVWVEEGLLRVCLCEESGGGGYGS